jgi:hypothetical protein
MEELIFKALTQSPDVEEVIELDTVPVGEKISFLIKNIDRLQNADRSSIGGVLVLNDLMNELVDCSQGLIINLDNLPESVITKMYDLLLYKLANVSDVL